MMHMPSLPMMVIIAVFGALIFDRNAPDDVRARVRDFYACIGRTIYEMVAEFKRFLSWLDQMLGW